MKSNICKTNTEHSATNLFLLKKEHENVNKENNHPQLLTKNIERNASIQGS